MNNQSLPKNHDEVLIVPSGGFKMLMIVLLTSLIALIGCIMAIAFFDGAEGALHSLLLAIMVIAILYLSVGMPILCAGFKVVNPNEALVLLLFGKYKGTITKEGFFWVNPFCRAHNPGAEPVMVNGKPVNYNKKLSLKAMTLSNDKQKVNDLEGNPIEIGVVVVWKIINTAKAVFNVENYAQFISTQADSAIRQVARTYPYDVSEDGDEKSLRGSSLEISEMLRAELQASVEVAGIEIIEAKIAHLAYAPEIAAAMLQRQQASAIIAARQKIVEGAVGMVEMALNKLNEHNVCDLDEERKAQMVSNLLVVLCGNKDAQPIVNSGTLY